MEQAAPDQTPFQEFCDVQTKLNLFLWPAEIAVRLVQQKMLTGELRESRRPLFRLFPEISCNAFKPPANGRFDAKYMGNAVDLNSDLDRSLSFFCKLVIVRFHRALERYIQRRCELAGLNGKQTGKFKGYVLKGKPRSSVAHLPPGVNLAVIPHKQIMSARIYAEVRHDLAHGDDNDTIDVIEGDWSDDKVFRRCKENRGHHGPIFENATDKERQTAIKRVCGGARRKASRTGQPLIFFYALFCFGAYRKLAASIEEALPIVPASKDAGQLSLEG